MDSTAIRVLQLVGSILGLIFAIEVNVQLLIIAFAVALIYTVIIFLGILTGRGFLGRSEGLLDLVVGIVVLVLTIWATIEYKSRDTYFIIALICGYVVGPLLIITGAGF